MLDYQERLTTGQTDRRTDGQTDAGQSDPYVPLCLAGDTKITQQLTILHGWHFILYYLYCLSCKCANRSNIMSLSQTRCVLFLNERSADNVGRPFCFCSVSSFYYSFSLLSSQTGIPCGTLEIVIQEVLWSIRGSCWAIWSNPLTNFKWHSDPWTTVTSLPIRLSTNFMTFIPSLTFTESWVVSMEHLQRVWLASRERLPFRTPGSVPHFGTC